MTAPRLSKSKILSGLQCHKRLWLEVHRRDLLDTEPTAAFAIGNRVGEVARSLHPLGVLIGHPEEPWNAVTDTEAALAGKGDRLLFEPAFRHDGILVRADIFFRTGKKQGFVEVKSSTQVKDYHLSDAAIQTWVLEGAGIASPSAHLAHINRDFVYQGDGRYDGLLSIVDAGKAVRELKREVPVWAASLRTVLEQEAMPEIDMGKHCNKPFDCPFQGFCSQGQPKYPVSLLKRAGKLLKELEAEGVTDLRKVPAKRIPGEKNLRIWRAVRSGKPEIDPAAAAILGRLAYPRYYLDFETINFAVPIWAGTRPYQQVPFQWSCHIEREPGRFEHKEFLDLSGKDPRRAFAESLLRALGTRGPILVYHQPFEEGRLKELAAEFPDLAPTIEAVRMRLVDLLPLTREHYYHRDMGGSWSIKAVLPTIAPELDYSTLGEVQDGGMAQEAFVEAIDPATPEGRKENLRTMLIEYCKQDTLAMTVLAARLDNSQCIAPP